MLFSSPTPSGQIRLNDEHGDGRFGTPRGSRRHPGIDYKAEPGDLIRAPFSGTITHVGYPYDDDLRFRYVDVSANMFMARMMYVEPIPEKGSVVVKGGLVGRAQDLTKRYPGIVNHIHLGIRLSWGSAYLTGKSGGGERRARWVWINPSIFL